MYKLLIVDDEQEVVEGLLDILEEIKETELEFFTANSAAAAITVMEREQIDIVISDIRMPEINGLDMYQRINARWPYCKVMFLSGVRDFDFAYQSIQNKDVRYLTKMEPGRKIVETVLDVINDIEREFEVSDALQQAELYYKKALPLLREQFLRSLFEGERMGGTVEQADLEGLGILLQRDQPILLFGMCFDATERFDGRSGTSNLHYMLYALQALCQISLDDYSLRTCFYIDRYFLVCLAQFGRKHGAVANVIRDDIFRQIQTRCRNTLKETVTIAYQSALIPFDEIAVTYPQIRQTLGFGHSVFTEGILHVSPGKRETEKAHIHNIQSLILQTSLIDKCIEWGDRQGFLEQFSAITDGMLSEHAESDGAILGVYFRIATMLLKYVNLWGLQEKNKSTIDLEKLMRVDYHAPWPANMRYLKELAMAIMEAHAHDENEHYKTGVSIIRDYIEANLEKDLSLTTLAAIAGLHPTYLSRLFKEATRQNMYSFILDLRMNRAMRLLKESNDRVQSIALATGYDNPQSFNRAFKKYTRLSPSEFRAKHHSVR